MDERDTQQRLVYTLLAGHVWAAAQLISAKECRIPAVGAGLMYTIPEHSSHAHAIWVQLPPAAAYRRPPELPPIPRQQLPV